jgi:hypothetical protein
VYTYMHSRALGLLSKGLFGEFCVKRHRFHTPPPYLILVHFQFFSNRHHKTDISIMAPKPIKLYSHAGVSTDMAIPIAN